MTQQEQEEVTKYAILLVSPWEYKVLETGYFTLAEAQNRVAHWDKLYPEQVLLFKYVA